MAKEIMLSNSDEILELKISASMEIFFGIVSNVKDRLESEFGKPNSYYEGEKRVICEISRSIFDTAVSEEDVMKRVSKNANISILDTILIDNRDGMD